jgi:SAM-dependent methyltransferase
MVTSDLIQCKPGEFRLDECTTCGHVFQNPQLNPEGMDFYYADFYGGTTEGLVERAFATMGPFYRARAETVRGIAEAPRRWLDVGGGHGHFCLSAKGSFPETTFDALDMNDSIEEAERRGWTGRSYQGLFPDRAPELAGRYDVVSMFHYLEHARDLGAELDAAATVLGPGGVLLIEVPDASSRVASLLGRFWWPWVQPQHLHFPSVEILTRLLGERGFEVVRVQEGPANVPYDFVVAAMQFLNWAAPRTDVPWRPRPTAADRAKRAAVLAAGWPLVLAGLTTDVALRPLGGRARTSNAYRLVAKRP